jgi:hypothetical protein
LSPYAYDEGCRLVADSLVLNLVFGHGIGKFLKNRRRPWL